jgi:hypothetical protein
MKKTIPRARLARTRIIGETSPIKLRIPEEAKTSARLLTTPGFSSQQVNGNYCSAARRNNSPCTLPASSVTRSKEASRRESEKRVSCKKNLCVV